MNKPKNHIEGKDEQNRFFVKGNPQSQTAALKTGVHSRMFNITGKVPNVRGARRLQRDMETLAATLEEITPDINAKKVLLIKQVVRTETLMQLIELYMKQHGILQPFKARKYIMELQPAMSGTYLSLLSQQRSSIIALGLNTEQVEAVLTPYEIAEIEDKKEAKKAKKATIKASKGKGKAK